MNEKLAKTNESIKQYLHFPPHLGLMHRVGSAHYLQLHRVGGWRQFHWERPVGNDEKTMKVVLVITEKNNKNW